MAATIKYLITLIICCSMTGCTLVESFTAVDDCRVSCVEQSYADGACRSKSLPAPEGLTPGGACIVSESQSCSQPGQCRCYCAPSQDISVPEGALTAAELLQTPLSQQEVTVYGIVYELGERYCPCFRLSSGGGDIEAWFTSFDDDAPHMEGIANGDRVLVTGVRKSEATLLITRIVLEDGE